MSPCQCRSEHSHRAWLVTDRFVIAGGSLSRGKCLNISSVTFFFFLAPYPKPWGSSPAPLRPAPVLLHPTGHRGGLLPRRSSRVSKSKTENKNYKNAELLQLRESWALHRSPSTYSPTLLAALGPRLTPFPEHFPPLPAPSRSAPPRPAAAPCRPCCAALRCTARGAERSGPGRAVWATCWA